MIKKSDAHKAYPRDTQVVRKGDPGWRSDRETWKGQGLKEDNEFRMATQRHISNPLTVMDGKIRQAAAREVDYSLLPPVDAASPGEVTKLRMANGRDLMAFRLVDGQWRYCWIERNAAL